MICSNKFTYTVSMSLRIKVRQLCKVAQSSTCPFRMEASPRSTLASSTFCRRDCPSPADSIEASCQSLAKEWASNIDKQPPSCLPRDSVVKYLPDPTWPQLITVKINQQIKPTNTVSRTTPLKRFLPVLGMSNDFIVRVYECISCLHTGFVLVLVVLKEFTNKEVSRHNFYSQCIGTFGS